MTVDFLEEWLYDVRKSLWGKWPCSNGDRPGRPAWDNALDDLMESLSPVVAREVEALIVQRCTEALRKFVEQYPDAPRAREKVAA